MNPLMITFSLLVLIATFTFSSFKATIDECLKLSWYEQSVAMNVSRENALTKKKLHAAKLRCHSKQEGKTRAKDKQSPIRRCSPLQFDLDRPPHNAFFNLYLLLKEPEKNEGYFYSQREIFKRLLDRVYGSFSFYSSNSGASKKILDALLYQKNFSSIDHLSSLSEVSFEDPQLQTLFSQLLKGGIDEDGRVYPSLFCYVGFDDKNPDGSSLTRGTKRINLLFAPKILLEAIYNQEEIAAEVCAAREKVWEKMFTYERERRQGLNPELYGRNELQGDLNLWLDPIYKKYHIEEVDAVFDNSLGKMGNYVYIKDLMTGELKRENLPYDHDSNPLFQ